MSKVKKISKYVLNVLTIINALIINIAPIWNINADKVTNTIAVIIAVISSYLLGNKAVNKFKGEQKVMKGIDVSSWQGAIDWKRVKNNIDLPILRLGLGDHIES